MDQRRPPCRDEAAHDAHGFWNIHYTEWIECPGWTAAEAATSALIAEMNKICREHYPPLRMPEGIRLECHPRVPYCLHNMFIPGYSEFVSNLHVGDRLLMSPQIPVMASPAMADGAWRLAHGERGQHLIAEGMIPR